MSTQQDVTGYSTGKPYDWRTADARLIREEDFPSYGTEAERLRFLLHYAVLAPSSYNSQPWFWRINRDGLYLEIDRGRTAPASDPEGRELFIACGAALFNLRMAAHHFGLQEDVHFFPLADAPDCLARINLTGERWPTVEDNELFEAIPRRRTCRQPFEPESLPENFLFDAKSVARRHGVRLRAISSDEREAVADLVQRGALAQGQNTDFRNEVAAWVRARGDGRADGMSPVVLDAWTFAAGRAQAARDRTLATAAPGLVLLDTDCDSPRDWVAAGEALQHILLHACCHDVAVSYFNQPIHVSALWRKLLQELRLSSFPQLLFRLGRATEEESVEMTPRRPLGEVLREE